MFVTIIMLCLSIQTTSIVMAVLALLLHPATAKWNATGSVKKLWATPVMEYSGLFSRDQLQAFADDVKRSWSTFLKERSDPSTRRAIKSQAEGTSTPNDKDRINEEFFNYQNRHPVNAATLEIVWQAFCFAVNKFVEETGMPPIQYQRESLSAPGTLEWTADKNPRRGHQYCWSSLQFGGTHHDVHTHPGSALAGTLYLEVPSDGGALSLSDPRGPMPPFGYAYRIQPEEGKFVIFPATVPHAVHATPGEMPRVSISCNYPGDWSKFTTGKTVFAETKFAHEMMSRKEAAAETSSKKMGDKM